MTRPGLGVDRGGWCFYCSTRRPSARKRKGFPRAICDDCVDIRKKRKEARA